MLKLEIPLYRDNRFERVTKTERRGSGPYEVFSVGGKDTKLR